MPDAARLYVTPDEIERALSSIRGGVTREESIVMAAAHAAASAARSGGTIAVVRREPLCAQPPCVEPRSCPSCGSSEVVALPHDWREQSGPRSRAIPIVACGAPCHYTERTLDDPL